METLKAVNSVSQKNEKHGIVYNYEHANNTAPDRINFIRQKKIGDKEIIDVTGGYDNTSKVLHLCFHTATAEPDASLVDAANSDIKEILNQFNL